MKNKKIQSILEDEAKKFVSDAPKLIRGALERSTLSLMGLSKNHYEDHYLIDHCNGRNSPLIDAFRTMAIKEAEKIASGVKITSEQIVHATNSFQKEFANHLNREVIKAAQVRAKQEADKVVESIEVDVDSILGL